MAELACVASKVLKDIDGHEDVTHLAAADDSGDAQLFVHHLDRAVDLELALSGVVLIDDDVGWFGPWAALFKGKAAAKLVELIEVDAGDRIEKAFHTVDGDADGVGDMGLLTEVADHGLFHRGGAHAEHTSAGASHDNVCPNAATALLKVVEHAVAHAHESEHHVDLYGDRKYDEECPDGPVLQVF